MTILFPIAFSNTPYVVVPQYQVYSTSGFAPGWLYVNSKSNSSFTMQWQATYVWFAIGIQQWGICNTKKSSDLMECAFPASNPKETLAIFATYFDDSNVYNGAILVKSTMLSSCIMKLWPSTQICFMIIGA